MWRSGGDMRPSQVKMGIAIICLIGTVIFGSLSLIHYNNAIGDEGWKTFCELPLMVFFAILGLWAWSSSNADQLTEIELEEVRFKRKKRRMKR